MKRLIPILTAAALLLAGCGGETEKAKSLSASDIYGTWQLQRSDCTDTYTFKADMTYTRKLSYTSGFAMNSETQDSWSLSGDTISIHYTDFGQVSDYQVTIEGNSMTWVTGDSETVYTKVS